MTRVGLLGYGEAGSALAGALAGGGARVVVYDRAWDGAAPASGAPGGVEFRALPQLLASVQIVLSAVTTDAALAAAAACVPGLTAGQVYCDLNSTAPSVKQRLQALIAPSGAEFVEGAILGAIGVTGARTRILLGGGGATALAGVLNHHGLNTSAFGRDIGAASTFKLLRSVFSKGLEALLLEFLLAAERAGLRDELWREISTFMTQNDFDQVARNWVCSHATAHARRAHEMNEVLDLVRALEVDPLMSEATRRFFARSTELRLADEFAARPQAMDEVVAALLHRLSPRG